MLWIFIGLIVFSVTALGAIAFGAAAKSGDKQLDYFDEE